MKLKWKVAGLGLLSGLSVLLTGCGGINASGSVSPASFLLPGLMDNRPAKAAPADPQAHRVLEAAVVISDRN